MADLLVLNNFAPGSFFIGGTAWTIGGCMHVGTKELLYLPGPRLHMGSLAQDTVIVENT